MVYIRWWEKNSGGAFGGVAVPLSHGDALYLQYGAVPARNLRVWPWRHRRKASMALEHTGGGNQLDFVGRYCRFCSKMADALGFSIQ